MMRSDKAKYAMGAAGVVSVARRQFRRALAVMKTQLESKCAVSRVCRERKSAERDQQALRGDGIRDDNADQRAQKAPGYVVPPEHTASHKSHSNTRPAGQKATFIQLSSDRVIWATAPKN